MNKGNKITKGLLEQLYEDIANSPNKPTHVRFQGIEYKTGSEELQKAIDEWRANNRKSGTLTQEKLNQLASKVWTE